MYGITGYRTSNTFTLYRSLITMDNEFIDAYEIQSVTQIIDNIENSSKHKHTSKNKPQGQLVSSPEDMMTSTEEVEKYTEQFKEIFAANLARYGDKTGADINELFSNLQLFSDPVKLQKAKINLASVIDIVRLDLIKSTVLAIYVSIKKYTDPKFIAALSPVDAVGYTDRLMGQLEKVDQLKSLLKIKNPDVEMQQLIKQEQSGTIEVKDPGSKAKLLEILNKIESEENGES